MFNFSGYYLDEVKSMTTRRKDRKWKSEILGGGWDTLEWLNKHMGEYDPVTLKITSLSLFTYRIFYLPLKRERKKK